MTPADTIDLYGRLTTPDTLEITRLLPGPVDKVWSYLTESDLRRKWLASGEMPMEKGGTFTLTWRNDDLTSPSGKRPEGFGEEHVMASRITELTPKRRLAFTWGENGEVEITLEPQGEDVLLTLVHKRTKDRMMRLMVGAGWHAHLDILKARIDGTKPAPFWDTWQALRADYDRRIEV
jgi:uncharacterized protein YndB with AHSA1/START domain